MTKEEVMSESEAAYFSTFFCWKNLWNILEQIIKTFKTIIAYMGFTSPSQDHAQPQITHSFDEEEEEDVEVFEEYVETTTSTSRSVVGGIRMFRAPPRRRTVSRGSGPKTD